MAHDNQYFYVYIMTNSTNTVLYTGFTSDLKGRVFAHKNTLADGFTKRYNVTKFILKPVRMKKGLSGERSKSRIIPDKRNPNLSTA